MKISKLSIDGLLLVEPSRIGDTRGFLSETFRVDRFEEAAGPVAFVQDNHSMSAARGTIRGLHYQKTPRAQGKLIRVTKGAILDVAVDIRRGSPTYGRYETVELSAENWRQLWVPTGFLHWILHARGRGGDHLQGHGLLQPCARRRRVLERPRYRSCLARFRRSGGPLREGSRGALSAGDRSAIRAGLGRMFEMQARLMSPSLPAANVMC
jgi:dTDP-4-dehydrorhamnose 3,5-epimerase